MVRDPADDSCDPAPRPNRCQWRESNGAARWRCPGCNDLAANDWELAEGLPLAERTGRLVVQRLHEIRQHGALVGLGEHLDRHARYELHVAELGDLFLRKPDADRVVA